MKGGTMIGGRLALGGLGVAAGIWGLWLMRDDGFDRLLSMGIWLAAGVIAHDFVLAPVVVVIGVVATKALPSRLRVAAAIAFLVWGTLTIAVANVLSGQGGKPGMDSLLNRPYVSAWLVLTGLALVAAVVAGAIATRRRRAADA